MTKKTSGLGLSVLLIILGTVMIYFGSNRLITLIIDGQPYPIQTRALTVGWAIHDAGIPLRAEDQLRPSVNSILGWNATITLDRASLVEIIDSTGKIRPVFWSLARVPGNILGKAGIKLYPGDSLLWNGNNMDAADSLPPAPKYVLQYIPGKMIAIQDGNISRIFSSSAATIGGALWQAGIHLKPSDHVSPSLSEPLNTITVVKIRRAIPVEIVLGSQKINTMSAGKTVGETLADSGVSLQGLDSTSPADQLVLPANHRIKVTHVKEEITLKQTPIPFETEFVADPNTELDQRGVIQHGQSGVKVIRQRVRYENGKEVSRQDDAEWVASPPVPQKNGYGTKVVIHTLKTENGTLQYWRAVNVYATSYSPCGLGNVAKCYYGTSLGLPVKRGVIAVTTKWYRSMAGQSVYVPGYGQAVIADIGAGIPGRYWIDLGFTDADLELWHQPVTLYFLTPVPANIPWILP